MLQQTTKIIENTQATIDYKNNRKYTRYNRQQKQYIIHMLQQTTKII